jgi:hypothetical protein
VIAKPTARLRSLLRRCTGLLILYLAFSVTVAAQTPMQPVSRVYTRIDDVRSGKSGLCRTFKVSGDRDNGISEQRCPPGPGNWPVNMVSGDARVYVGFGRQAKDGLSVYEALEGAFADPHPVIEWRLRNGEPYAAIHRYFLDGKQALTVHRLNPDRTSCVAAVVPVERGRDANAEAVKIADELVPAHNCGSGKLISITRAPATETSASRGPAADLGKLAKCGRCIAASITAIDGTNTERAHVTAEITGPDVQQYCEREMPAEADVAACLKENAEKLGEKLTAEADCRQLTIEPSFGGSFRFDKMGEDYGGGAPTWKNLATGQVECVARACNGAAVTANFSVLCPSAIPGWMGRRS